MEKNSYEQLLQYLCLTTLKSMAWKHTIGRGNNKQLQMILSPHASIIFSLFIVKKHASSVKSIMKG
jgi:hypothetical protein